jgi:hypothetical protein
MRSVTYSMSMSLDGYIVGPDGKFDWTVPEEVFRFWIDEIRGVGVHLMGRRLYETMLYWETADQDPSLDDAELEWAALWNPLPKVVFSTTLSAVQGNARLAPARAPGGSRTRRDPHLQLESRLPPLPRGALALSAPGRSGGRSLLSHGSGRSRSRELISFGAPFAPPAE